MSTLRCFVGVTLLALLWTSNACQLESVSGFCGEQEIDEAYVGCNETSFPTVERLCESAQEVSWEIATTFNELEDIEEDSEFQITLGDVLYGSRLQHFPRLESLWLRNCSAIGDLESEWIEFNQSSEGSDDLHVAPLSYEQARSGFVTIRFVWERCTPWTPTSVEPVINVRLRRSEWSIWWQNNWFPIAVVAVFVIWLRAYTDKAQTDKAVSTARARSVTWRNTRRAQPTHTGQMGSTTRAIWKNTSEHHGRPLNFQPPPQTRPGTTTDSERRLIVEAWGSHTQSLISTYRSQLDTHNAISHAENIQYVGLFPVVNTAPPCDDAINDGFDLDEDDDFLDWTGFDCPRQVHWNVVGIIPDDDWYEHIIDKLEAVNTALARGIWSDALSRYPHDLEHNPPRTPSDMEAAFKLWVKVANEMSEARLSSSSLGLAFFYDPSGDLHTKIYCAVYALRTSSPESLASASLSENSVAPVLPPQPPSIIEVPIVTPPQPVPSVSPPPRYTSAMAGTSSNPPSLVSIEPPPPPAYEVATESAGNGR